MKKDIIYYTRDCYVYCKKNDNGEIVIKSIEDAHKDVSNIERQLKETINKIKNYCYSEIDKCKYEQSADEWECCIEELKGVLSILKEKEK